MGGWRVGKGVWLLILAGFLLLYSLLPGTQVEYQEESLNQLNPEFYSLEDSVLLNERRPALFPPLVKSEQPWSTNYPHFF